MTINNVYVVIRTPTGGDTKVLLRHLTIGFTNVSYNSPHTK